MFSYMANNDFSRNGIICKIDSNEIRIIFPISISYMRFYDDCSSIIGIHSNRSIIRTCQ